MKGIEEESKKVGVVRGGLLLLPAPQALQMIERCRELGIRVLGIDGFVLTLTTTQPVMEHSVDFTSVEHSRTRHADVWDQAAHFMTERLTSPLLFEVVHD